MAYFKNLLITIKPPPSIILLSLLLLFLSLFILSSSSLSHLSPSLLASSFTSRLIYAANYFSPFSSSSSNTCNLSSVASAERVTRRKSSLRKGRESDPLIKELSSCDIFDGKWLVDDLGPVYLPGSCPYMEDKFNCYKNGRPDSGYLHYTWQPHGCTIPRFDGKKMLEILRGKRLVFVGDSLNRNMWESLVCALRQPLKDKSRIFEVSGRSQLRTRGFYSIRFKDYRCSIDFVKSPFLVQESEIFDRTRNQRETLRLDVIQVSSSKYRDADIIIFNTGHWWTHQKPSEGEGYFQEGNHVYNRLEVTEAYAKALHTWAQWVDANINSSRSRVFFIGYSSSHFRKGKWSSGGRCEGETSPITNETHLSPYPWMMRVLESVISEMKTPVFYMNITKMTGYRRDGHPSIYRQPPQIPTASGMLQDCSHWCLPGVPDSWNQLLYATLLVSQKSFSRNNP